MTPERWRQIEELFHEALELEDSLRSDFIVERSAGDTELKVEVEKLLSQFDDASSFIEQPLYDRDKKGVLSALLDDSDDDPMVGSLLGNYRIEREIGRGGMGAVYEALRADGEFRLRVAVKVVKRGIDTDFVLRRFRNERQILAALDHPYITRLIDGGTTDDGRPYFVMELIDGLPLYRYCDKQRLTINERLRLFCRVTEAVEYAHQKLVIHRDLKPSNIFIANDGTPRLLDFGIAKLLDPELASDTLQPTATALRMMTVDYASPEQVRGEKVTYATDVYSLGVILFELLTGHRPYRVKSRSPHDVARAICDDEPVFPSRALTDEESFLAVVNVNPNATTLADVADLRRDSPTHLSQQLRGNLDNIILKALLKDAKGRYGSVAEFRADIERHLSGEEVAVPYFYQQRPQRSIDPSRDGSTLLAVLPLSLMSPSTAENTDESYLTVGLADAIITRLTSVQKLTVRPTSSITRYNEHQINPFRAGLELGVDFVLDGRIRRFGERLRISLQLLDVKAGSAIWAGQFDEHLTGVLEMEDAISEQVAAALIPQLTGEDRQKLAKRGTNDPKAYESYLRGRFFWNQFTSQSLPRALEEFQTAVSLDPEYALAHVGIADFYIWANIYGLVDVKESYVRANASVRRALEIDRELGEAYASFGLISLNRYEYEKTEHLFRRALEISPHYPLTHEWYSAYLVGNGRFDEGMREIVLAEELDPMSLRTKVMVVWSYYQAHQFEKALAKADEIISLDENYPQGHLQRGYILCEVGRANEGVKSTERALELMPGSSLVQFQYCFVLAAAGRHEDAARIAAEMIERSKTEYIKPMFLGLALVAAGKLDEAFEYLEIAAEERDPWMNWFATEPKLESIRTDERYLGILKRIRKSVESGKIRAIVDTDPNAKAPLVATRGDTLSASELPTLAFRQSLLHRHYGKLAAVALLVVGLFGAYASGILTISISPSKPDAATTEGAIKSVAVMPFENGTKEPGFDYISDGMSENLIARMRDRPDLRTISRTESFKYRSRPLDQQTIGRELGVDAIISGALTKNGDEFTVKAEMTRVSDGKKLFSMFFAEKTDHIVALQDVMASRVIETLSLTNTGKAIITQKSYTDNNEAFQYYLKGEFERQKSTPDNTRQSIENYENAIKIDPNYALAYQGLALAYRSAPDYGLLLPNEAYPKAEEMAQKALSIDPTLSTAYVALASIKATYDWKFADAEEEYKRAIAMGPNNAETHFSYGNFLIAMGRGDEGMTEYRNAQQLEPMSQYILLSMAWARYIARHYDEAETEVRRVIDHDPKFARAYINLGEILQEQGRFDEAIASIQKARELSKDPLADMALGHVYAISGRTAEATKIAVDLEDKVRKKEVSPFLPAVVYAGLNEKDKAFYWLERAYQERSNWLTLIKVGRRLKNLHSDPRFDDLLKRVGF